MYLKCGRHSTDTVSVPYVFDFHAILRKVNKRKKNLMKEERDERIFKILYK